METKDRDSRQGSEEGVEKSNVVRLPRDWLGPREELVPFGPSAYRDRPEVEQHLGDAASPSLTQDDFWGGDLDAVPRPVVGPKPLDGFSVRRTPAAQASEAEALETEASETDACGADVVAPPETRDGGRTPRLHGRRRRQPRARSRAGARRAIRPLGWPARPSLPAIRLSRIDLVWLRRGRIHLDCAGVAARRRAAIVGLAVAVVVSVALFGPNLIAPAHRARKSSQIAEVSRSPGGLVAPPPHVAGLRPAHTPKRAVASRGRAHGISRPSPRSTLHQASRQSTPTQSYHPAPTQPVQTVAVSETPTTSTSGQSATTARQTSSSAAGPTGLGSQVGTNCNPKCR